MLDLRGVREKEDQAGVSGNKQMCVMLKVTGVHVWKRVFYFFPIGLYVLHQVYPSFPQNSLNLRQE